MGVPAFERVHFIGIGGAGMSGIALVLHQRGVRVTGSDLKESRYVRELRDRGIDVRVGHAAATVDEVKPQVVVVSTAIPESNPELARARELGIEVWHRARMLAALGDGARTVAVAGTHGKTTTSSMVASMLDKMGWDPSFLIGGVVEGYNTNGRNGEGGYFVCEAAESDGSFLVLDPYVAVVTNVEADHLDHYGSLENIERAFVEFMGLVPEQGAVIVCGETPRLVELARESGARMFTYGFDASCDYVCRALPSTPGSIESHLAVSTPSGVEVPVTIHANPGRHNMLNATAALAVADVLGGDIVAAADALSRFKGARRRFTQVGTVNGITVVDDYGHHPTEIAATLEAASSLGFKRVVEVFQPHRYTRTRDLAQEFGRCFERADKLVVMDVFSAGDEPIPGVSGKTVVNAVREHGAPLDVSYVPDRHQLLDYLCAECREGDLLITQGAGDITAIGPAFIKQLEAEEA